jgi:hypothetical protein
MPQRCAAIVPPALGPTSAVPRCRHSASQQRLCASACPARPCSPNPAHRYSVTIPTPLAAAKCPAGKATHEAAAEPTLSLVTSSGQVGPAPLGCHVARHASGTTHDAPRWTITGAGAHIQCRRCTRCRCRP